MDRIKELLGRLFSWLEGKSRVSIHYVIVLLIFGALGARLFYLTGIRGAQYRQISETKRLKRIVITAPRGEIRDRKGQLIAGNRPVFTVQLRKDELAHVDTEKKNRIFRYVANVLEEDGARHLDDFPLELNVLRYRDQSTALAAEISPEEEAAREIVEHDLVGEFLLAYKAQGEGEGGPAVTVAKKFIEAMDSTGEEIPIEVSLDDSAVSLSYTGEKKSLLWKSRYGFAEATPALEALVGLIGDNDRTVQKVLEHPICRRLAYELLNRHGLGQNLHLSPIANRHYLRYEQKKLAHMRAYPAIRMESSAREDFLTIFRDKGVPGLLAIKRDEKGFLPGEEVAKVLEGRKGLETIHVKEEKGKVSYRGDKGQDLKDLIIGELHDEDLLAKVLETQEMKTAAQQVLIEAQIVTGISVGDNTFRYTEMKNLADWQERYRIKTGSTAEEAFQKVKDYYKIPKDFLRFEAREVMNIYDVLIHQGSLGYMPLNFAYKISDKTVARLAENIEAQQGIDVSPEPIRAYPLGQSSAHILGYLGKISGEEELKEYVEEKGYERDALIGKSGIERTYEEYLHGKNGSQNVEVDSLGNTTRILKEEEPEAGNNVYLSIDLNLQKRAELALGQTLAAIRTGSTIESPWGNLTMIGSKDKGRPYVNATSGAVMAVDVRTGKVLAMASFPSYDPNLFATGISSVDWEGLKPREEKNPLAPRPLFNVATQSAVQPGSIFKMVTSLAALEKGLDPAMTITDGGYVEVGGSIFGNWLWNQQRETQGDVDLYRALQHSNNYYFYSLALGEDQRKGIPLPIRVTDEDIAAMARKFGLGERTGLEIQVPAEAKGSIPDPKTKRQTLKSLFRHYLDAHLQEFFTEDFKASDEEKAKKALLALFDEEEVPSRERIVKVLEEEHLDTKKHDEKRRIPLADLMLYDYLNQAAWNLADSMNVTIGQGANAYTLAQMSRYTMAIANGGTLYPLSLVDHIADEKNVKNLLEVKTQGIPVEVKSPKFFDEVKEGMRRAALTGAPKNVYENFPVAVGIKTGTAERAGANPYTGDTYDSFSWQVAFAPYDQPEIAVCCLLFQGGPGSNGSALIREVMAEYFGLNKTPHTDDLPIEMKIHP